MSKGPPLDEPAAIKPIDRRRFPDFCCMVVAVAAAARSGDPPFGFIVCGDTATDLLKVGRRTFPMCQYHGSLNYEVLGEDMEPDKMPEREL